MALSMSSDSGSANAPEKFGKSFREKFYEFEDGFTNLNHGSFGVAPKPVLNRHIEALKRTASAPDGYMRQEARENSVTAREAVAKIIDCDVQDLVLTANATTGVNAVLRSLKWAPGDLIVRFSTVYVSCDHTLLFMEEKHGVKTLTVDLKYPLDHEAIVKEYKELIQSTPGIKLALFDTISSMPSDLMPWQKLCQVSRENNILSLVDGAHGIGITPISLREARPTFFTSNLHKWFYLTHSSAALYVDREWQRAINSLPVSGFYARQDADLGKDGEKYLENTFEYVGTLDHGSIDSVPTAVEFVNGPCGGLDRILKYQAELARDISKLYRDEFGIEELGSFREEDRIAMVSLSFPLQGESEEENFAIVNEIMQYFLDQKKTFIPLSVYRGTVYMRLSAAIYLELDDFKVGIESIKAAIKAYNDKKLSLDQVTANLEEL